MVVCSVPPSLNYPPSGDGNRYPRTLGYIRHQETGLYYLQSRYYNPEWGRFINADSVLPDAGDDALGYNLFAYCRNNPVNLTDPNGNWPSWATKLIIGTVVIAAAAAVLTVAIEAVKAGDYVWASDPEMGEVALKQVVQTFVNEATELVRVTVESEEIVCTTEHPFYSPVKGWTAACKLRAGDILVTVNGEYVVVEKVQHEILETPVKVYNFEVADFHTYYVSNRGVLVHNLCTKSSGSYEIFTADNRVYVGKGSQARMQASIRRLQKQGFSATDSIWESARDSSTVFVNEYMKMAKYNFDFGGVMINKIMSLGFKVFSAWL